MVEIMSCFGLAALRLLGPERGRKNGAESGLEEPSTKRTPKQPSGTSPARTIGKKLPNNVVHLVSQSRPPTVSVGLRSMPGSAPPSNVFPMQTSQAVRAPNRQGHPRASTLRAREVAAHVNEFIRLHVKPAAGASLGAYELRAAYEAWCTRWACEPLSQQKLGAELTKLGFARWKSCGLIRYKGVRIAA